MKKLTIFTPTYNRAHLLNVAYKSLIAQKEFKNDFIWLIVDDGSSDNTKEVVKKFIDEGLIEIKYHHKANGGKYTAMNSAFDLIETEYSMCLDSDDFILENGLGLLFETLNNDNRENIGFVFPRTLNAHKYDLNSIDNRLLNISDIKLKYGFSIETAIVFRTRDIKEYRFVENEERFASEEILYNMMIESGKFLFKNHEIVGGEYLEEGLTNNIYKLWFKNYKNTMKLFLSRYKYVDNNVKGVRQCIEKLKCIINISSICMKKGVSIFEKSPNKFLTIVTYIPAIWYKKSRYNFD